MLSVEGKVGGVDDALSCMTSNPESGEPAVITAKRRTAGSPDASHEPYIINRNCAHLMRTIQISPAYKGSYYTKIIFLVQVSISLKSNQGGTS